MPAIATVLFKRRCQFQGIRDSVTLEPEQAPEQRLFCRRHGRLPRSILYRGVIAAEGSSHYLP